VLGQVLSEDIEEFLQGLGAGSTPLQCVGASSALDGLLRPDEGREAGEVESDIDGTGNHPAGAGPLPGQQGDAVALGGELAGQTAKAFGVGVVEGVTDEPNVLQAGGVAPQSHGGVLGQLILSVAQAALGLLQVALQAGDSSGQGIEAGGELVAEPLGDGQESKMIIDSSVSAHKVKAGLVATALDFGDDDAADGGGAADVGAAAGAAVGAFDFDDAHGSVHVGGLAQIERQGLLGAEDVAADGAIFVNDGLGMRHDLCQLGFGGCRAGEIDGEALLAEMEADRGPLQMCFADGGEQMLAAVLLHVIPPSLPVDAAMQVIAAGRQVIDDVKDGVIEGDHIEYPGFIQCAGVVRLAAAGGIEEAAVEDDVRVITGGNVQDACRKMPAIGVGPVEFTCDHGICMQTLSGPKCRIAQQVPVVNGFGGRICVHLAENRWVGTRFWGRDGDAATCARPPVGRLRAETSSANESSLALRGDEGG